MLYLLRSGYNEFCKQSKAIENIETIRFRVGETSQQFRGNPRDHILRFINYFDINIIFFFILNSHNLSFILYAFVYFYLLYYHYVFVRFCGWKL